jgi:molecular chaperone GrpE (heat shock protein)
MLEDLNPNANPAPHHSPPPPDDTEEIDSSSAEIDADVSESDEELLEWKDAMRRDFEAWLESVDEISIIEEDRLDEVKAPDLYSFYEEFAAAGAEARKANRRTAEAFSQWGETLTRFESELKPLRESVQNLKLSTTPDTRLSRSHSMVVIELADRIHRLVAAFDKTPNKHWWGNDLEWRTAWENQRQGLSILKSHLEDWLKKEGVERFSSLGQPFDPSIMSAVATDNDPGKPHHTVLEEIAPGYRRQGELLRVAQVKVSLNKI